MSNEYKDWLTDRIQDEVIAQGLLDEITDVWDRCYVEGLKNGKQYVYYVTLTDEGWLCRHEERSNLNA